MEENIGFPCELPIFVHVPGSNPYVFYLELKGEALEAVGVLERVTDVLAGHGVPILQVSVIVSGGTVKLVVFADVREKKLVDKLVTELSKVPYTINVSYTGPLIDGFAYCDRCFPLTVRGERAIILSRQVPSCSTCSVSSPAASPTRGTRRLPAATREPR